MPCSHNGNGVGYTKVVIDACGYLCLSVACVIERNYEGMMERHIIANKFARVFARLNCFVRVSYIRINMVKNLRTHFTFAAILPPKQHLYSY